MLKRILLATACSAWLAALPAVASEPATLVLKSGERVQAELIDHGGVDFTVRVNGAERRIPTDDVAVIEFTGSDPNNNDIRKRISAGQPFVVLRNGQIMEGRLYDIGGVSPLRVSIDTPSGQRDLSSAEVAQVYMAPSAMSGAVATTGSGSGSITVPGNADWTNTNVSVRSGEMVTFNVSGQVRFGPNREHQAPPAGAARQRGVNAPLNTAPLGALIGRVDDGQPFLIGNQRSVKMPASGTLHLRVNDDIVTDNSGSFQVTIAK